MEPKRRQSGEGISKADKLAELEPETEPSEKIMEAPKDAELIVQDLLGDFSEQTGASFG